MHKKVYNGHSNILSLNTVQSRFKSHIFEKFFGSIYGLQGGSSSTSSSSSSKILKGKTLVILTLTKYQNLFLYEFLSM